MQLLLKINAYFSRFYCNKTCPSYEFLVVFRQVRVWDQKSVERGGHWLGWSAGRVRAKFLKLLRVQSRVGSNFVGMGRVQTQNFNPCRTLIYTVIKEETKISGALAR